MSNSVMLPLKDGNIRQTINSFLQNLLSKEVVEAVLVPVAHPSGNYVVHSLVTDTEHLEQADALAPVMPVVAAKILQSMTRLTPVNKKTAIVIRSCEMRALVELVKLKQAQLENILIIGVDCPGAYSVKDYAEYAASNTSDDFVKSAWQGKEDEKLRAGCKICQYPAPLTADIVIGLIGIDLNNGILLQADTKAGEEALKALELDIKEDVKEAGQRETTVNKLLEDIKNKRKEFFEQVKKDVGGIENISAILAPCINCHNCRTACPVCYCRECFFESPTFELEADKYIGSALKKGAIRMPTDTLLFHLTRMSHMGSSCVGCGACEEACPNDIPLLKLFQLIGSEVQELFNYIPGRSLEEELPPVIFRENELEWIGEK